MASRSTRGHIYSFALLPALLALFGAGEPNPGPAPAVRLAGVSAPTAPAKPRPVSPFSQPPGEPDKLAPLSPEGTGTLGAPASEPAEPPASAPAESSPLSTTGGKLAPTPPGIPLPAADATDAAGDSPSSASPAGPPQTQPLDPNTETAPGYSSGPDAAAPGPSARPPVPPRDGLQPQILVPQTSGPAIPVPGSKTTDWGDEDYEADEGPVAYAGILGTIKDAITKAPVENVEISIPEVDLRALSSKDGLFMIRGVRVRNIPYEVLIEAPGYEKLFTSLEFPKKGRQRKEFLLKPLGW